MDKNKAKVLKTVKNICDKNGKMDWEMHVLPVLNNAAELADILKADKEVVEISACLHDIALISSGKDEGHDVEGAKIAEEMLRNLGYDNPFIEKVSYCILHHRGSAKECKTLESKILNSADAMAHFDNPLWLVWIMSVKGLGFKRIFEWLDKKFDKDWNLKIQLPEAREIARPKYEAAKLLLESSRRYIYGN